MLFTINSYPVVAFETAHPQVNVVQIQNSPETHVVASSSLSVPFYSQFKDIVSPKWQKVGCGIASLAMIVDYYVPNAVTVNELLLKGIDEGAYDTRAGWKHSGLMQLAKEYGLEGASYDISNKSKSAAFIQLQQQLAKGPVMVSIHYKFDPKSTIPHIVVLTSIHNGMIRYNDPAAKGGNKEIAVSDFLPAWKSKYIVLRPVQNSVARQTGTISA